MDLFPLFTHLNLDDKYVPQLLKLFDKKTVPDLLDIIDRIVDTSDSEIIQAVHLVALLSRIGLFLSPLSSLSLSLLLSNHFISTLIQNVSVQFSFIDPPL